MRRFARSYRAKLMMIIMVTASFATVFACGVLFAYEYLTFHEVLVREMRSLCSVVAANSSPALVFDRVSDGEDTLRALRHRSDIDFAGIYHLNGEPFVVHERAGASLDKVRSAWGNEAEFVGDHLWLRVPIVQGGDTLGMLVVCANVRQRLFARLAQYGWIVLIAMLVSTLISYVMSNRLQRVISGPIHYLAKITRIVSKDNDYSVRAEKGSEDEVGQLVDGFNKMLADIEARDEELVRSKEAAEAASTAKSQFLANMSHELRTPLHGILSFASFGVKRHESSPRSKLKFYFERIAESGNVLLGLLNDLLDLAKLESGRTVFDFRQEDVLRVVLAATDEFKAVSKGHEYKVHCDLPGFERKTAIDPKKLRQVVRNLLSNATKFSPPDSTIDVTVARRDKSLHIAVRDRGCGLPEDQLESVFDKFVQSTLTTSGAGGTGLGLSICREIVHAHSGRIWAENNPDEESGATFRIQLPIILRVPEQTRRLAKTLAGATPECATSQ